MYHHSSEKTRNFQASGGMSHKFQEPNYHFVLFVGQISLVVTESWVLQVLLSAKTHPVPSHYDHDIGFIMMELKNM